MKKIFTLLSILFVLVVSVKAQDPPAGLGFTPSSYYTFSWNTTFTMGDFNKWVGNASPAGFDLGGRYFIN